MVYLVFRYTITIVAFSTIDYYKYDDNYIINYILLKLYLIVTNLASIESTC